VLAAGRIRSPPETAARPGLKSLTSLGQAQLRLARWTGRTEFPAKGGEPTRPGNCDEPGGLTASHCSTSGSNGHVGFSRNPQCCLRAAGRLPWRLSASTRSHKKTSAEFPAGGDPMAGPSWRSPLGLAEILQAQPQFVLVANLGVAPILARGCSPGPAPTLAGQCAPGQSRRLNLLVECPGGACA